MKIVKTLLVLVFVFLMTGLVGLLAKHTALSYIGFSLMFVWLSITAFVFGYEQSKTKAK